MTIRSSGVRLASRLAPYQDGSAS
ncbi:hypothetical protein MICRO8M_90062 [Microbacterium sp. 8M]|nr:hypothetical protein MICRO8M_90062 [Microbacterium sp. 8M]